MPLMTSEDVTRLSSQLEDLGVQIWIDGGWGVDALLEEQTRSHKDLDIVIEEHDLPILRRLLESQGYREVRPEEGKPWNFVLADGSGHEIDVHVIVLDVQGNGIYGPEANGQIYPASSLTGAGRIAGRAVKCISPQEMVRFHTGYRIKDSDVHDVSLLCARFGIELPAEYARLVSQNDR